MRQDHVIRIEENVIRTEESVIRTEGSADRSEKNVIRTEENVVRTEESVIRTEGSAVRSEENVIRTEESRTITEEMLEEYRRYLLQEEKSASTISKYLRDVRKLADFVLRRAGAEVTKELVIDFKESLLASGRYQISSINSFLVAVNRFLEYEGWSEARVKLCRIQRAVFCPDERHMSRGEYLKLAETARHSGRSRIFMVIQTLCATGIRISELQYITAAGVRRGSVQVRCKGKTRIVMIPDSLRKQLLYYIQKEKIERGLVFRTSGGRPLDRSNIWREMKSLCTAAGVAPEKVFPHNLRHLFAQSFYQIGKDIVKLADVLGHSSIETTRIYTRTTSREHRRQLERMELVLKTTDSQGASG